MYLDDDSDAILSVGRDEFDTDEPWEELAEEEVAELEQWEKVWRLTQEKKST